MNKNITVQFGNFNLKHHSIVFCATNTDVQTFHSHDKVPMAKEYSLENQPTWQTLIFRVMDKKQASFKNKCQMDVKTLKAQFFPNFSFSSLCDRLYVASLCICENRELTSLFVASGGIKATLKNNCGIFTY